MRDTDIYDGRHRAPDPPPDAAADTGSKHATAGVNGWRPPIYKRGERL